jgi:primase-polymerase (primpol)-like protein
VTYANPLDVAEPYEAPAIDLRLLGALVTLLQWVVWRYEDTGRDKPSKVPYNPRTLRQASVNKLETWGSHNQAVAAAVADGFDGIGFVFTEDDECMFLDLDHCLDEYGIVLHSSVDNILAAF